MALPDWVREMHSPLDDKMGLELTEVSPERCAGSIPVAGNEQIVGIFHGGANGVLVESLASMAANAHARTYGKVAVGVDLNVTHIRSVSTGRVSGVATAIKLGRSAAMYDVELTNDEGQPTARGRLTCQLIDPR